MKRVVFVDLFKDFQEPHGIYSLSAVLRQSGVDVHYVGEWNREKSLAKVSEIRSNLVLYSSFSHTLPAYTQYDKALKQVMDVPSIIGGPGPTYNPRCIDGTTIDALCVGEGEDSLVDILLNGLRNHKNIMLRDSGAETDDYYDYVDLDALPFPDRDLIYDVDSLLRDLPQKHFVSGRGCPYDCTYCFNHAHKGRFKGCGRYVRKKSVEYMLEEIKAVRKKYPLRVVVFNDDTFIVDKKWFFEFIERFRSEIDLPYTCNVRANLIDEDIARVLRETRCMAANWSIESGNDHIRNSILKRNMSRETILKASQLFNRYGITFRLGNLIGLPGETRDQMLETVDLNIHARPFFSLGNIYVPYPGLELTEYAVRNGYYSPESEATLPQSYYLRSVLNFSDEDRKFICKLMLLFPFLVRFPFLFKNLPVRNLLFKLPNFILRLFYEALTNWKHMNIYTREATFWQKCQIAMRYVVIRFG